MKQMRSALVGEELGGSPEGGVHIEEPKISSDGASTGIDEHGKPHVRAQLDPPGMNRDLERDLEGNSLEKSLERSLEHSLEQHLVLEQQAGFLSDEEAGGGDSHASRPEASPLPEVTRAANPYYHDDQARTSAAESTREGTSLRGREHGLRQLFVHIWFSFIKSPQWSFLVTSPINRAWMNGASRAGWESTREAARKRRRPHWLSYSARCSSSPSLLSMRCVRPLNGRTVSEPHISPRARYSATRWRRGGEMKMMHSKRSSCLYSVRISCGTSVCVSTFCMLLHPSHVLPTPLGDDCFVCARRLYGLFASTARGQSPGRAHGLHLH